jgi:hypothetical protein
MWTLELACITGDRSLFTELLVVEFAISSFGDGVVQRGMVLDPSVM